MRLSKSLAISLSFIYLILINTQSNDVSAIVNGDLRKELRTDLISKKLVAHACGGYKGLSYTNSLNAIDSNYDKGFRFFEVDFHLTKDNKIVLIHDWVTMPKRLFGDNSSEFTEKKFRESKTSNDLVLMDINLLILWLKAHKDAFIVTDCKVDSYYILKKISNSYKNMLKRFYVQMGYFDEYTRLMEMGYTNIILALYYTKYSDVDVLKFADGHRLYAVSMDVRRAETNLPLKLKNRNVKVYAHSVNSLIKYKQLLNNGVYGIYTDTIPPSAKN
jgi:Glycerophosphoryl diester phosphodiesterase